MARQHKHSPWVAVVAVTAASVAASAAFCFALYAVLGMSLGTSTGADWVMILAPILTPLLIAPVVSWPVARSRQRVSYLLREVVETRARLEEEMAERQLIHEQLAWQVSRDPLTGVLNRRGFFEACGAVADQGLLVLTVDVDDFKRVNDERGHAAGDTVLCAIAAALEDAVGPDAVVGRLGGDEFVAVLDTADDDTGQAVQAILGELAVTLADGSEIGVSASVGCTRIDQGVPIDSALAIADERMYSAKRARSGVPR